MIIDLTLLKVFIISFLKFLYLKFMLSLIIHFNDNVFAFLYPSIYISDNDDTLEILSDSESDTDSSENTEKCDKIKTIQKNNCELLENIKNKLEPCVYDIFLQIDDNEILILECFVCNITKDNIESCQFKYKLILLHYLYKKINCAYIKNIFENYRYLFIQYKKNNEIYYKLIDLHTNIDLVNQKQILFNRVVF